MKRSGDGPLSAETRLNTQINVRISRGAPWTETVSLFQGAINKAISLGLQ
jgi:hypothetical protein